MTDVSNKAISSGYRGVNMIFQKCNCKSVLILMLILNPIYLDKRL